MIAQWGSREGGSLGGISRRRWWVASWISPGRALHAYRTAWKMFYRAEQHFWGWEAQVWCARSLTPETDTVWARGTCGRLGHSGITNVALHWCHWPLTLCGCQPAQELWGDEMEGVGEESGTEKEKKGKVKERRQKEEMQGIFSNVVFCLNFLVCLQFFN